MSANQTPAFRKMQSRNSRYLKDLRKRATPQERVVKMFLDERGIYHHFQKGLLTPFHRIIDFYFPFIELALEIDGPYHTETRARDQAKDDAALGRGMRTLRITNAMVDNGAFKAILLGFLRIEKERWLKCNEGRILQPKSVAKARWILDPNFSLGLGVSECGR